MTPALLEASAAGCTVLTPNGELAAALFDAIERAHRAAGEVIWPTPAVSDFGSWLKDRHLTRLPPDAGHPRMLNDIEERELWLEVVAASAPVDGQMEPAAAARAARRAYRALAEYGIPREALAADGGAESGTLLEWIARFESRCRALECMGAAQLLRGLALAPPAASDARIVWIESPGWRPAARRWLTQHAGEPLVPPAVTAREPGRAVRFASPADELAELAAWARQLAAGDLAEGALAAGELADGALARRGWILVPDLAARRTELEDAFDAELAPARFALEPAESGAPRYALAGGTPLAEQGPVRTALDVLAAGRGQVSFERFSALLRSGALQADDAEAAAAARTDLELRRSARSEAPLVAWLHTAERASRSGTTPALARLRAALGALDELSGRQPMSRWAMSWIAAFEAGPWAFRERWSSAEYQAAERFRELLSTLATGDRIFGAASRATAEAILERAARATLFQPQTGIPPIWVSSQIQDPWLAYDGIWITGCDAQRWPPPPSPIPLLPVPLQRRFGIAAAAAHSQLADGLDLLQRWRQRAAALRFSSAADGEGRGGRLSVLVQDESLPVTAAAAAMSSAVATPPAADAATASLAFAPNTAAPATPRPHWHRQRRAAPRLESWQDDLPVPFGAEERTRGVRTLRAQSHCAFKGFTETRLGVRALDKPLPGFSDLERGILLHHALQLLWMDLKGSAGLAAIAAGERERLLERCAREAVEHVRQQRDPGAEWCARERSRLVGLLGRWLEIERLRAPFTVEDLELAPQAVRLGGLDYTVRIDRVDRLTDGTYVLIDYKTGAVAADWRGSRPENPQLPIYALTLRRELAGVAYGRINAAECRFCAETDRRDVFKPGGRPTQLEGRASLKELVPVWEERIERLARDVAAGRAVLDPLPTACASCRFQAVCRVELGLVERAAEDSAGE